MNLWKEYKVQILLCILAVLEGFAYFYPGYAKGLLFAVLQGSLAVLIIWFLYVSHHHVMKHKLR